MGPVLCRDGSEQLGFSTRRFEYQFGEDNNQVQIIHEDTIETRQPSLQKLFKKCADQLKKSSKLYKDNSMKTEPLMLKSLRRPEEDVSCTYERPYVFLSNEKSMRGKPYRIANIEHSTCSQILVRDEALQHLGVFLCFIADNLHLIRQIILTQPNSYGIHCIKAYVDSVRQPIFIDDYILCSDRLPLFSQPVRSGENKYMWTCLLEKAWIKINGSITRAITIVQPQQVFKTFLSYPMKTQVLDEQQNAVDQFGEEGENTTNLNILRSLHRLKKNTGCIFKTRKNPKHKLGISGGKQFYFIAYLEYKGSRLYYLRNPCSRLFDFRGKFSNLNEELTQQIKEATGEEKIAQGNFVLQEEEVLEQVQSIFTIHYEPSSTVVSEEILDLEEEKELFLQFQLTANSKVSICFQQQYNFLDVYSPLSFLIIEKGENQIVSDLQNLQGSFGVQNTHLLEGLYKDLKAGRYLIRLVKKKVPQLQTISKQSNKLVITASQEVKIDQSKSNQPQFKQAYIDFLREYGRSQLTGSRGYEDRPHQSIIQTVKKYICQNHDFKHIGFWVGDLAAIYIKKTSEKKQIRLEVGFPELENLMCTSKSDIKKGYSVFELTEEDNLIIFEKIDLSGKTNIGTYSIDPF